MRSCNGADGANLQGFVLHPLNGHVCQHTAAASRQSGVEGTDGSAGLKVMPLDSVTLSDGHDPREHAPTRSNEPYTAHANLIFSFLGDSLQHALISSGNPGEHEHSRDPGQPGMTYDPGGQAAASSLLTKDGPRSAAPAASPERLVEVAVPVYNEEKILARNVRRLHSYLTNNLPFRFIITIADNASTDGTFAIARQICAELPGVRAVHLDCKGRGLALRHVWGSSDADIVAYMDADLSTGLDAFLPLIAPLLSGHSDLATGSRLAHGAQVVRGPKREIISRSYNLLLRTVLSARFSDAQCGFKAGRTEVIRALLPQIEDNSWFFDTELLMLAQRKGLRIYQVPVAWIEDPDSSVDIVRTALADLRGVARLRFAPLGKPRLNEHGRDASTECHWVHTELSAPEQPR